jgi:hypothetical protein
MPSVTRTVKPQETRFREPVRVRLYLYEYTCTEWQRRGLLFLEPQIRANRSQAIVVPVHSVYEVGLTLVRLGLLGALSAPLRSGVDRQGGSQ